jgi:hypothetical protein
MISFLRRYYIMLKRIFQLGNELKLTPLSGADKLDPPKIGG